MNEDWVILEPIDWRYSAAIAGLLQYLRWLRIDESEFELTEDALKVPSRYINDEADYLRFVEYKYPDDMHHLVLEEILLSPDPSENQIKMANEKMSANTILKKIFKKMKFNGSNAKELLALLNENREEIIRETYRNKNNLYRNYCNTNQLFEPGKDCCRLLGYYVDMPKKGKSIAYNFNISNFVGLDDRVFDFIPFAFAGERDFFFINDNTNLIFLERTNRTFDSRIKKAKMDAKEKGKNVDARQVFFESLIEMKDFVRNDIEVITKNVDQSHFETLYLRKKSMDILKSLADGDSEKPRYRCFCFKEKISDNYWMDVHKTVTDAIMNLVLLDDLIDYFLKNNEQGSYKYVISQLISLNIRIKGEKEMDAKIKSAYASARRISDVNRIGGKIPDNKLNSYIQKLTSALTFEDYDRFCMVLLNLANFAGESCDFSYDLFEDFEKNKELAYTFVNALRRTPGGE